MSFSTKEDTGAILVTKGSVVKDAVYHNEPYRAWCKANMATLLENWPDIRNHGLWVVTSTWSTTEAGINLWKDTSKTLTIGFETSFAPAGEIGPSGGWHTAQSDTGWIVTRTKNVSPPGAGRWAGQLRYTFTVLMEYLAFRAAGGLLWRHLLPIPRT